MLCLVNCFLSLEQLVFHFLGVWNASAYHLVRLKGPPPPLLPLPVPLLAWAGASATLWQPGPYLAKLCDDCPTASNPDYFGARGFPGTGNGPKNSCGPRRRAEKHGRYFNFHSVTKYLDRSTVSRHLIIGGRDSLMCFTITMSCKCWKVCTKTGLMKRGASGVKRCWCW